MYIALSYIIYFHIYCEFYFCRFFLRWKYPKFVANTWLTGTTVSLCVSSTGVAMWHVTCAVFSRVCKVQCFSTLHCTFTEHRSNWGISSLIHITDGITNCYIVCVHIDMVMCGYGEFTQAMETNLRRLRKKSLKVYLHPWSGGREPWSLQEVRLNICTYVLTQVQFLIQIIMGRSRHTKPLV